jgi:hypothetical protein
MLKHLIERLLSLNGLLPRTRAVRSPDTKTAESSHNYTAVKRIGAISCPKAHAKTKDSDRRDGSVL